MNAPAPTTPIAKAAAAAAKHAAAGTTALGQMVVLTFAGMEIDQAQAAQLATEADLTADDLPDLRDRGAIRKALQYRLGIYPSARHNSKAETPASAAAGEGACLRFSSVSGEKGDVIFTIFKEEVQSIGGQDTIVQRGEVQRMAYFAEKRQLKVYEPLLRTEMMAAFSEYQAKYKSDSIRTFASRTLDRVGAVKFAGSCWFVPTGGEETVAKLIAFVRKLDPSNAAVAVAILDEPVSRAEVRVNASASVLKDVEALQLALFGHAERRDQGTRVRDNTVNTILDKGRELREKLRTLKTLLGLEVSTVEAKLTELDKGVRTFLEKNAQAEAQRLKDAAAKAAAQKGRG
jgi:hypothetical protein